VPGHHAPHRNRATLRTPRCLVPRRVLHRMPAPRAHCSRALADGALRAHSDRRGGGTPPTRRTRELRALVGLE
jgi:hypothetical protein